MINKRLKYCHKCIILSQGLPRYEARTLIIQKLKQFNLLRGSKEHKMSVPICSRTGDVIELLPKLQWYYNIFNFNFFFS